MNVTKIGSFEAIALLLIVSINHLLLNMPQTIIDTCGSASLLNTVYTTILAFIIAYLILFLLFKKFPSCDILDVSNYLGGKNLGWKRISVRENQKYRNYGSYRCR